MTRAAAARAALLVALCGASLGALMTVASFVRARNLAGERRVEARAADEAARLAAVSATAGAPDRVAVHDLLADRAVLAAEVICDAPSARYPFLHARTYCFASDPRLAGRRLHVPSEKPLYDLAGRVLYRREPAVLDVPGGALLAAAPIAGGSAVAVVARLAVPPRLPFPALATLGLLVAAALAAAGLATVAPRARHLAGAATGGLAAVAVAALAARVLGADARPLHALALGIAGAVCSAALGVAAWRGAPARTAAALSEHRAAYACLLPGALAMTALVIAPLLFGLGLSCFSATGTGYRFVGLANFRDILSGGGHALSDPLNFWFTLGVTFLWTFLNVLLHVTIGVALALLLFDERLPGRRLFRVLLIAPWAVPSYITALTWHGLFDFESGAVDRLLHFLHVPAISWFSTFLPAFSADVVANTWLGFPFMMVVTLGALASIPRDLHEAAAVDGASRAQTFFRVTLPLLRPALAPAAILGSIWTFNMFNVIYLVSGGKPEGKTDILVTQAYRWAFERGARYGMASAYGTLIFVLLIGYTLVVARVTRAAEAAR